MEQEVSLLQLGGVVLTVCGPLITANYLLVISRIKRIEDTQDKFINGKSVLHERVARLEARID